MIVVLDPLIGQAIGTQPIKNTVSYGVLSSISLLRVRGTDIGTEQRFLASYDGSIGGSWLAAKQTSSIKKYILGP